MRTTSSEMRLVYLKWQDSGLNRMAFCKQEKISYPSFNYWYKQFTSSKETGFSEITLTSQKDNGSWAELIFPSGVRMVFPSAPPIPWLKKFLG